MLSGLVSKVSSSASTHGYGFSTSDRPENAEINALIGLKQCGIEIIPAVEMEDVEAEYARLTGAKEALEAEIGALVAELTSGDPPAGVSGPLVDADGFPRADIDVYRVRHQRHALVCRQNDHCAVMRSIEALLPA